MIVIFEPSQGYPTIGQELTIMGLGGPNPYSRLILSRAKNSVKLWYQPNRLQTSREMVAIKPVLRGRFDFGDGSNWSLNFVRSEGDRRAKIQVGLRRTLDLVRFLSHGWSHCWNW